MLSSATPPAGRLDTTDLELLRRYEPVLRFTCGEAFFPVAVEDYVAHAALWAREGHRARLLVPAGMLDLARLATVGRQARRDHLFLRFVTRPLEGRELQRWLRARGRRQFQAPGRLARVGLIPRLLDAAFSLSLLLRGTVPGGTVGAALGAYRDILAANPRPVYYGRVLRVGGYIVLHYLFFYVMNDWRSSFDGANDHEADWEQIMVFLDDRADGPPAPAWLAFAQHDEHGDDLRRRWDDPDLTREGTHPVVFVAGGSHACYFEPGDYLASVEIKRLRPLLQLAHNAERLWRNILKQGDPAKLAERVEAFISVPFVDYARGDGVTVGPEQGLEWYPVLIDGETDWVEDYRGLWGLDTRDPFASESAPAGPKYRRDGTVRLSWYNPLGWCGLNKVAPPHRALETLLSRIDTLTAELTALDAEIAGLQATLPQLELETLALRGTPQLARLAEDRRQALEEGAATLNARYARRVELVDSLAACARTVRRLEEGDFGSPWSHLRHPPHPQTSRERQQGVLAEVWSALSIGILLLALAAVRVFALGGLLASLGLALGTFVVIDATLHRRLERLLLNVTIVLAVITSAILIWEFRRWVVLLTVVLIALLVMADNLRELRRR